MVTAEPLAPEDVAALAAEIAQDASPAFRLVLADELRASAERLGRWRFTDRDDVRVQTAIYASVKALAEAVELWTETTRRAAPPSAAPFSAPAPDARGVARARGYSGDACRCGSFNTRRNGTCQVCDDCGETTGCS